MNGKDLYIDLAVVNDKLKEITNQLEIVDDVHAKLVGVDLPAAWKSTKATEFQTKMEEGAEYISSMRSKIDGIRANVAKYSSNVSEVDASVTLNSGSTGGTR